MSHTIKQLPVIKFEQKGGTELYDIRFSDFSWAFLLINEEIGIVSIVSDYGNWSAVWMPKHHGRQSLKHFIAEGDCDYLAKKLMRDEDRRQFNCDRTIDRIKEQLLSSRRDGSIEADEARSLYDDIEGMERDVSEDLFWERVPGDVHDFLDGDYSSLACFDPTNELLWLRDGILPALVAELKKKIERTEAGV